MIRPGFYLGRAYANKVFLLNFMLLNDEVAEAGIDGFAARRRGGRGLLDRRAAAAGRSRLRLALCMRRRPRGPRPRRPRGAGRLGPAARPGLPRRPALPVRGGPRPTCAASPGRRTSPTALIPLGRSLAALRRPPRLLRLAAASSSRSPATAPPARSDLRLADRLFLGYQPAAEVIEAISYDPDAGRFAFQQIVGYGRGPAAPAEPAERGVCLACHQAGGPIFARPLWSESNANADGRRPPRPARRQLPRRRGRADRRRPRGLRRRHRPRRPHRARRPALAEGCPDASCRAALLAAALRAGLGAGDPRRPAGLRRADTPALARRRRRPLARPAEPRSATGLRRHRRRRCSPRRRPRDPPRPR